MVPVKLHVWSDDLPKDVDARNTTRTFIVRRRKKPHLA